MAIIQADLCQVGTRVKKRNILLEQSFTTCMQKQLRELVHSDSEEFTQWCYSEPEMANQKYNQSKDSWKETQPQNMQTYQALQSTM